jgi:uncharacterized iron-regulated membrane protein
VTARAAHRVIGLVMLLPFIGWAITGAIFFLKPGYGSAYDPLVVKTYPLTTQIAIDADPAWLEVRYLRTVLGDHLLVRTAPGWRQLDLDTRQVRPAPSAEALRTLLNDAFTVSPQRYGHVTSVDATSFATDTGVRGTINWNRLALTQHGPDTDRIDWMYRIHYLQWTGDAAIDKVLGAAGLACIVILSVLGTRLFVARR